MKSRLLVLATTALALISCNNSNDAWDATGIFEATEIVVSSEGTGKLLALNIEEGDTVSALRELGVIDTTQLHLKKRQLQATRNGLMLRNSDVTKQLAALEYQLTTLKREYKRAENLVKAGVGNTKQLDDITSQMDVINGQIEAQKSTLTKNNAALAEDIISLGYQLDQVNDQINKSIIFSPISGTILSKYSEPGEFTTTGKPLFRIANLNKMILKVFVLAPQLNEVEIGKKVTVSLNYGDERLTYDGTIEWIANQAEFTPKTIQTKDERANLVYAIKVSIVNDGKIKIGMYGDILF